MAWLGLTFELLADDRGIPPACGRYSYSGPAIPEWRVRVTIVTTEMSERSPAQHVTAQTQRVWLMHEDPH